MKLLLLSILFLTSCTSVKFSDGKNSYSRTSIGTKFGLSKLTLKVNKDGILDIEMVNYSDDQASTVENVAKIAAPLILK